MALRCGTSEPCVTAPSDPCEGPVLGTIENVRETPAGAVPLNSSVAATSFVVCTELSVAITVVGSGGVGSAVGLILTTASPVAPAPSRTRKGEESATFAAARGYPPGAPVAPTATCAASAP